MKLNPRRLLNDKESSAGKNERGHVRAPINPAKVVYAQLVNIFSFASPIETV